MALGLTDERSPGGGLTPGVRAPWIVVTGLDGSGKSTLVAGLAETFSARAFRLPHHDFVHDCLARSGDGSPFGDVHTDRLVFALDARLANYTIRDLRCGGVRIVSQRGWMDNFIFGAVQGVAYEQVDALMLTAELERPCAHIYLVADPEVAFSRIENAPDGDKYETADFLALQHEQTMRFFVASTQGGPALDAFAGIPSVLIDTTRRSPRQTYAEALAFLEHSVADFADVKALGE